MQRSGEGARYLEQIEEYNLHTSWGVRRDRACLLVIDMQNHFLHPEGRSFLDTGITSRVRALIDECRKQDIPVVFTRHQHSGGGEDLGMLGQWWSYYIEENTWDSEIVEELEPGEGDMIIRKNRYSAFRETGLEEILRSKRVQDLLICGVMTNLCCETTARDAFVRDFRVFFLADGTATSEERMHISSLRNLAFGFAVVKSVEEVMAEISVE